MLSRNTRRTETRGRSVGVLSLWQIRDDVLGRDCARVLLGELERREQRRKPDQLPEESVSVAFESDSDRLGGYMDTQPARQCSLLDAPVSDLDLVGDLARPRWRQRDGPLGDHNVVWLVGPGQSGDVLDLLVAVSLAVHGTRAVVPRWYPDPISNAVPSSTYSSSTLNTLYERFPHMI